jgi:hypothetical protein
VDSERRADSRRDFTWSTARPGDAGRREKRFRTTRVCGDRVGPVVIFRICRLSLGPPNPCFLGFFCPLKGRAYEQTVCAKTVWEKKKAKKAFMRIAPSRAAPLTASKTR